MKPAPATTPLVERKYLIPFVLITSLFALWGFEPDGMTDAQMKEISAAFGLPK